MTDEDYVPEHAAKRKRGSYLRNDVYDVLKFVALVLLPAAGSFYFSLADIWGLPKADEVVGTIVVIDTFLGVMLGLSNAQYRAKNKAPLMGFLDVCETEEDVKMVLNFPGDPYEITERDKVTFKVRHEKQ